MTGVEEVTTEKRLLKKAIDLFTFLGRAQQLQAKPVRTVDQYEKVIWLGALPSHPALESAHRTAAPEADSPILTVRRVPRIDPPSPASELQKWLETEIDDPGKDPSLRAAIYVEQPRAPGSSEEDDTKVHRLELVDAPEIVGLFDPWFADWRLWAEREQRDKVVRDIYKELFGVHLASTDHSEEFELVLGVGCLSWLPDGHVQVRRHVATVPIAVGFDESTGDLTVAQVAAPESVSIEVDMLDPSLIASPAGIDEIRQLAAEYDGHVLDKAGAGDICRRLVHRLDADAEYDDETPSTTMTPLIPP